MGLGKRLGLSEEERFQSTHPVWDGTLMGISHRSYFAFQSTHPVWDGTGQWGSGGGHPQISIHPSRVGWDRRRFLIMAAHTRFQSTHPVWDGTTDGHSPCACLMISIHPSRVGWDSSA